MVYVRKSYFDLLNENFSTIRPVSNKTDLKLFETVKVSLKLVKRKGPFGIKSGNRRVSSITGQQK